ncbi:MAG: hypothetical protein AB7O39_15980 [Flavobacteriaceae bacterium]
MHTRIYRLEPIAQPQDNNWDLAPSQGTVIVRARSPADARIVASEAEDDFLLGSAKPARGASTRFASAFRSEKLYGVFEDDSTGFAPEGERGLLRGELRDDILKSSDSEMH